jgi:hypothetical protein
VLPLLLLRPPYPWDWGNNHPPFSFIKKCAWASSEITISFHVSVFQFTLLGTDPYHKLCYKELHHPKCDVCLQFVRLTLNSEWDLKSSICNSISMVYHCNKLVPFVFLQIPTNRSGLIEYRAHPFWGQKYCPLHEQDRTPRCCSCEKMEVRILRENAKEKMFLLCTWGCYSKFSWETVCSLINVFLSN